MTPDDWLSMMRDLSLRIGRNRSEINKLSVMRLDIKKRAVLAGATPDQIAKAYEES